MGDYLGDGFLELGGCDAACAVGDGAGVGQRGGCGCAGVGWPWVPGHAGGVPWLWDTGLIKRRLVIINPG